MIQNKLSYLLRIAAGIVFVLAMFSTSLNAANVYLDPDTFYLTGGMDEEFDLQLKVDENITGMRLFQVYFSFDPNILDTVSSSLGDLFATSGYGSFFKTAITTDTLTDETFLRVEALLLGPSAVVDGPGILANIRLKVIGFGVADLSPAQYVLTDINNDTIPGVTAAGAIVYADAPPPAFSLISPYEGEELTRLPGDSIELAWESSSSYYPGENVEYRLIYSKTSAFVPSLTDTVYSLTDTTFQLYADDLTSGFYYWNVCAIGDIYGYETCSDSSWFDYSDGAIDPEQFDLLLPIEDDSVSGLPGESFDLVWSASSSVTPGEGVYYDLEYGLSATFAPAQTTSVSGLTVTEYTLYIDDLTQGTYYWRVTAIGDVYGGLTASNPFPGTFRFFYGAVDPEVFDLLAPVDNLFWNINSSTHIAFDWEDAVSIIANDTITYTLYVGTSSILPLSSIYQVDIDDISSFSILKDDLPWYQTLYWKVKATNKFDLFRWSSSTRSALFFYRGDLDVNESFDIADVVFFVDFMFNGGSAPTIPQTANANCDSEMSDIADLVFLIDYMFNDGAFPGCN